MYFGNLDLGIDLGTDSVLVYQKGKGIVLREPSVVAVDRNHEELLAVGAEAHRMLGRTPEDIEALRPLSNGVISDYRLTQLMLQHFIERAIGTPGPFATLRMMICVPSSVTEVERRSVEQAAREVGAHYVRLVEEPLAAAIGAGIDISKPYGAMVVDIGGGTTDVAVLSMGGCVLSDTVKTAGNHFDQALIRYIREKFNILIGEASAERVKMEIGTVWPKAELLTMEVTGRSLITGLPKTITVTSEDTREAFESQTIKVLDRVRKVLEETPPDIASDFFDRGITLTGGGSLIFGLDRRIEEYTQLPCTLADDPVTCVLRGTQELLDDPHAFRHIARTKKRASSGY